MQRYFIKLSYDGTNYHGWQSQDNACTVQSEIENALSTLLTSKINITGAGRTDTGVHAREYYAHFDFEKFLNNDELNDLTYRLNSIFPSDMISFIFSIISELCSIEKGVSSLLV